jgi:hypothetical protein
MDIETDKDLDMPYVCRGDGIFVCLLLFPRS